MINKALIFLVLFWMTLSISSQSDSLQISCDSLVIDSSYELGGNPIAVDSQLIVNDFFSDTIPVSSRYKKAMGGKFPYSHFLLPTALLSYGVITRFNKSLEQLDHNIHEEIHDRVKTSLPIDDYMQLAPAVGVYAFDICGVRAKNTFRDRTFVMATSYLMMGAIVHTSKTTISIRRPNNGKDNSFPSGHTATAFVGAHILYKEYKHSSPWVVVGGYTMASLTGAFRMYNQRHWLSDVITGAGVGILCVELSYLLLPSFQKLMGNKLNGRVFTVAPSVVDNRPALGLSYTF